MYDLGYDLVVEDSEMTSTGTTLVTMADKLEKKLTAYDQSLARILAGAVMEGNVATNLADFRTRVTALQGESHRLAGLLRDCLDKYVGDLDRADKDIY